MKLKLLLLGCLSAALILGVLRFLPPGDESVGTDSDPLSGESRDRGATAVDPLADPDQGVDSAGQRPPGRLSLAPSQPLDPATAPSASGSSGPWTIEAMIERPQGLTNAEPAAPPVELTVYAYETRVSPVAIQRELSSNEDSITYARIASNLFDGLERSLSSEESLLGRAIGSAPVESQILDGQVVWIAKITLPANRERAFLHAVGGGFSTYEAVEARVDAPRVWLRPATRASLTLKVVSPLEDADLDGAYARLELKRATAARKRSADPSMTAYRADRGLDAAGETLFNGIPSGGELTARILHGTLPPIEITIPALTPGERREETIQLPTGFDVSGRVVKTDGSTVAGATVTAALPGESFGLDDEVFRTTESEDDGTFTLRGLPTTQVIVRGSKPGLLNSARIPVAAGNPPGSAAQGDNLQLVLEAGRSIQGLAKLPSGKPAAGLTVYASFDLSHIGGPGSLSATRGASNEAQVQEDGSFTIGGLGQGPFTLKVSNQPNGKQGTIAPPKTASDADETLTACRDGVRPGQVGVELILGPAAALRGVCIDDLGNPIEGETLTCARIVPGSLGNVRLNREQATTGPGGAFSFEALIAGTWGITLVSEKHVTTEEAVVEVDGTDQTVEVSAVRSCTIKGTVLDPDGQPVAKVRISQASDDPAWRVGLSGLPTPEPTNSSADGQFVLMGVIPGDVKLAATSDDFAPVQSESLPVEPGSVIEDVTLRMTRGGTIEGVCFDSEGRTASGRLITVQSLSMTEMKTLTSSMDGTFRQTGLTPGRYQVIAMDTQADLSADVDGSGLTSMMENMEMTIATVAEDETEYVFLGAPPASPVKVTGKIELAGEPRVGTTVVWMARSETALDTMKITTTNESGEYELMLDDAGPYGISVSTMTNGTLHQQITAEFSAEIPLRSKEFVQDFELPGGAIAGKVTGADGAPAAGVRLSVVGIGGVRADLFNGGSYCESRTEPDGTFEVVGLKPGSYQVMAGGQSPMRETPTADSRVLSDPVSVGRDQRVEGVDLNLTEPGAIEVTVLGSDGMETSGYSVFLRDEKGRHTEMVSMTSTNSAGKATIHGLAPGRYSAFARNGTLASQESPLFEVRAGETSTVELSPELGVVLVVSLKTKGDGAVPPTRVQVLDPLGLDVTRRVGITDAQNFQAYPLHEHRFGPLGPGRYTVMAESPNGLKGKRRVGLEGGGEKRVTILLK